MWQNRRVLVTGHTGFKGGWLALWLAERLLESDRFAEAWNFGPSEDDARPVGWVVDHLCGLLPEARWRRDGADHPHEAGMLRLDSTKARQRLGWRPRWGLKEALARTVEWHRAWQVGADMAAVSLAQIEAFEMAAAAATREAA